MSLNNRKMWIALVALSCLYKNLSAQIPTPVAYVDTVKVSYVREWEAKAPDQDPAHLVTRPVTDVGRTTNYVDGLGRPLQTVVWQETPLGRDMVTANIYDLYGREQYKFLPFAANVVVAGQDQTGDGNFKLDPFQQQSVFSQGQYSGERFFYGQVDYEGSPMNRVFTNYSAGDSWVGATRGITKGYLFNAVSDSVEVWNINMAPGSLPVNSGQYPAGTLSRDVTTDEHNNQVVVYKDKSGHMVLKKVQLSASPGTGHAGWLNTYFVYDSIEALRFVIQPRAVELINTGVTWTMSQSIADELCFRYEYDFRGRMMIKKLPGAGEVWLVYDARDRLVLTQDSVLRRRQQWLFTRYDALNRQDSVGLITDPANYNHLGYHQSLAAASTSYPNLSGYTTELLAQTWYDNYNWVSGTGAGIGSTMATNYTSNGNYFITSYNSLPAYAVPIVAWNATQGQVTGSMSKVLGSTSQYLYTVSFYDDHSRVVQTQATNYTGGIDTTTTQYDFSSKPLRILVNHQKNNNTVQRHTVLTRMSYDPAFRVSSIWKNIDGASADQLIDSMKYDELGQLMKKYVGTNAGAGTVLDSLAYDRNIRGWLTGINKQYVESGTGSGSPGNYFGLELGYDKATPGNSASQTPQFNGNIAGAAWKSAGDGVERKYDYSYDKMNRVLGAAFTQNSGAGWNSSPLDFTVSGISYDANGNLMGMSQNGFKLGSSGAIDVLAYTYLNNGASNKLRAVVDGANDQNSKLGDFHYNPAGKTTTDYNYDGNGNLTHDINKGVDTIVYNHLNLPQLVHMNGKGNITFTYDAMGNKWKKMTTDSLSRHVTTTLYLGGFVYQQTDTITNPNAGIDTLQFVAHEEGKARWAFHRYINGGTGYGWEYDFMEKDHLGNTRMILTQQKDTAQYMATMEAAYRNTENALFYNIPATSYARAAVPGTYPTDGTTNPNDSVARVNGSGQKMGPAIILKVMAGDKFDVVVKSFYHSGGTITTPVSDLSNILASLASGLVSVSGGAKGSLTDLGNTSTSPLLGALNNYGNTQDVTPPDRPKAYLNWIVLDNQFQSASSKAYPLGSSESLVTLGETGITVPKSGYLYIWVSNETPGWDVFFDNLSVKTYSGPMLEENHYYPYGLTMAGISDKALKGNYTENKIRFNGKELQNQEFSDGSGLEEYDYGGRMYDVQIGRWMTIDPMAEKLPQFSPYNFCFNNPERFMDPDGFYPIEPKHTAFYSGLAVDIYKAARAHGASAFGALMVVSQSGNESNFGTSPAVAVNNFFGILGGKGSSGMHTSHGNFSAFETKESGIQGYFDQLEKHWTGALDLMTDESFTGEDVDLAFHSGRHENKGAYKTWDPKHPADYGDELINNILPGSLYRFKTVLASTIKSNNDKIARNKQQIDKLGNKMLDQFLGLARGDGKAAEYQKTSNQYVALNIQNMALAQQNEQNQAILDELNTISTH
jgi:RHS repeat-associated protein